MYTEEILECDYVWEKREQEEITEGEQKVLSDKCVKWEEAKFSVKFGK